MEDRFKMLNCNDNDVLSFGNAQLFKFGRFREKLKQTIIGKVNYLYREEKFYHRTDYLINQLRQISVDGVGFGLGDIKLNWSSPREGVDCEILRIGSSGWQKGKLRSDAFIELFPDESEQQNKVRIQLNIEFCPDEPEICEPESPLDDLRQMIHQGNQQQNS